MTVLEPRYKGKSRPDGLPWRSLAVSIPALLCMVLLVEKQAVGQTKARPRADRPTEARPTEARPQPPRPAEAGAKDRAASDQPSIKERLKEKPKPLSPVIKEATKADGARLTLAKALAMAMEQNLDLKASKVGVKAAKEMVKAAWGGFGPHISVSGDFVFQGGESAFGGGSSSGSAFSCDPSDVQCQAQIAELLCGSDTSCMSYLATSQGQSTALMIGNSLSTALGGFGSIGKIFMANTFKAGITAVWPLFNAATFLGLKQAKLGVRMTRLRTADTAQDVALKVRVAFYQILQMQELAELVRSKQVSTDEHLRQTKALMAAGSATQTDVLRWEAEAAQDRLSVIQAMLGVAQLKIALNNILGRPLRAPLELVAPDEVVAKELPRPEGNGWDTITDHPQLELARSSQKAKHLEYRMVQSRFLPKVNLTAQYSWQHYIQYLNLVPNQWLGSWLVSINISIPIFDSMIDYYSMRSKHYEMAQLRIQTRNLKRALDHQLKAAQLDLASTREQVNASKKQVELAQAAHKSTENLFKAGDAKTTDLLDAQSRELQAKGNLIRARYDYLISLARLRRAAGKK